VTTFTVEQLVALKRVCAVAAAPDGSWLAVAVQRLDRDGAKYVSDLWKLPTDGSAPVQLTRGDSKDASPCFRHDGALGFLSNRSPNEVPSDDASDQRMQVWLLPAEGGEPRQLTDEPLGIDDFRFARQAPCLVALAPVAAEVALDQSRAAETKRNKQGTSALRYTQQPVRHWDHWLHQGADRPCTHVLLFDADGAGRTDLTPEATREFGVEPDFDVSDDGRRIVITRQSVGKDREIDTALLVIDTQSHEQRVLGEADGVNFETPRLSPDGERIAAVRSVRSAKSAPRPLATIIGLAGGDMRQLAAHWDRWPLLSRWSADGKQLLVTADDDGHTPVFTIDAANGTVERITSWEAGGAHTGLDALPDGRICGIRSTMLEAPECFVVASTPVSTPTVLARLSGFTAADAWAEVESFATPSTDGAAIQAFLLKPKGATAPLPLALWIHGGPIGMASDGWHWRWNPLLLVAAGYAVALPNPRGSTGFGQDFVQGIWGNTWGAQCYQDLMAMTDALVARPDIDAARTMAMGGSFGGYMTNWVGTQTERFKCLITHASIVTMAQFTGTTDHPPWWYLEMGGEDPYADPEEFDRYAPIRHIQNWKTPALIIHGERDYRCPISEGLTLFEALQYHGVPSELLIFPDENHWILRPANAIAWYHAVLEFIDRHLHA
jgi:dipeptidyl aminopeptidase/acylaminoacyl peptidase